MLVIIQVENLCCLCCKDESIILVPTTAMADAFEISTILHPRLLATGIKPITLEQHHCPLVASVGVVLQL